LELGYSHTIIHIVSYIGTKTGAQCPLLITKRGTETIDKIGSRLVESSAVTNTAVGPWIDGYQFQVLSEGYEPYMFYVYHQLYDEKTGKPIEGGNAEYILYHYTGIHTEPLANTTEVVSQ